MFSYWVNCTAACTIGVQTKQSLSWCDHWIFITSCALSKGQGFTTRRHWMSVCCVGCKELTCNNLSSWFYSFLFLISVSIIMIYYIHPRSVLCVLVLELIVAGKMTFPRAVLGRICHCAIPILWMLLICNGLRASVQYSPLVFAFKSMRRPMSVLLSENGPLQLPPRKVIHKGCENNIFKSNLLYESWRLL